MQTRQELILDFMKAIAATENTARVAVDCLSRAQDEYVRDVYLLAAKFADKYIENV